MNMNNIAIIPARSGSKGLRNKNIKDLAGKPLISYTIEAALNSGVFSKVMVSTDSEEYAEIAIKYGAEVPFLRSASTSSDNASSWDVVKEVLSKYRLRSDKFDMFALLQPTSPLRNAIDIRNAYDIYIRKNAKAVVATCEMEHSPQWCNILPENYSMDGFLSQNSNLQRQKLDTYYRINGSIYMVNVESFLEDTNIYQEGSYAYVMSTEKSVDIDTELDFCIAETIISQIK